MGKRMYQTRIIKESLNFLKIMHVDQLWIHTAFMHRTGQSTSASMSVGLLSKPFLEMTYLNSEFVKLRCRNLWVLDKQEHGTSHIKANSAPWLCSEAFIQYQGCLFFFGYWQFRSATNDLLVKIEYKIAYKDVTGSQNVRRNMKLLYLPF